MAKDMIQSAREATVFLKALANENRLLILCHLVDGEKSVSELERLLQIRQPTLSQQLARLRTENLVKTRRDAKTIFYSLKSEDVVLTIQLMSKLFCERDNHPVIQLTRTLAPAA